MTLSDSLSASGPRRQLVIVAALGVVICTALAVAYFTLFHTPYTVLFSNLRPADAAMIVGELDKRKTPYSLKDGGATILAPANLVDATRLNIVSADLPLKGAVGFEQFNKSDIGLTEFAQKINYQRALQGELARTIMTMDTVDSASVHLSLPDPTIFRDDRRPPKASVTVLPRAGKQVTSDTVWGIQRLVSAAVSDLDAANVVVLDERGAVVSSQGREAGAPDAIVGPSPDLTAAGVAESAPALSATPRSSLPSSPAPTQSKVGGGLLLALGAALVLLLLSPWGLRLIRSARRPGALTADKREQYLRRLKTLLDDEEAHVRLP
ncbi:MAG: hypothetical protein JWM33_1227 [Caulobacteraceae bacterium]|nr:hypothetical protein [Caulobacteraceae bacterium]